MKDKRSLGPANKAFSIHFRSYRKEHKNTKNTLCNLLATSLRRVSLVRVLRRARVSLWWGNPITPGSTCSPSSAMADYAATLAAMEAASMHRSAFDELSDVEYDALVRMAQSQGTEAVARAIGPQSAPDRKAMLSAFMAHEVQVAQARIEELESKAQAQDAMLRAQQAELMERTRQQEPVVAPKRPTPLKVDVGKYRGLENESLLRWLVEVEAAMSARLLEGESLKVAFAMSNLAGRAKTWAFGRRLADQSAFPSYSDLKRELKATFEPPKTEFRARAEFLDIRQGKRDIHAYCQYARYLVSCVVEDPIDDSTQVVAFLKGLTDGPVKTYLFREYPVNLEEAISIALQEDFSLQQAYVHSSTYRPPRANHMHEDGTEPMDLSAATEVRPLRSNTRTCHRCGKPGHMAYECMAPRPAPRARQERSGPSVQRGQLHGRRFDQHGRSQGARPRPDAQRQRRVDRPKNGPSQ
jgi:hypothetical protein